MSDGESTEDREALFRRLRGPASLNVAYTPAAIPDHELVCHIARGSYGDVWLARNLMGTYRAVKVVQRRNFKDARPFERELTGIKCYEPISRSHDGLVDILQIGHNPAAGCFYYIMEVGDDLKQGTRIDPATYVPRTLARELAARGRLGLRQCLRDAMTLTSALAHLHEQGLVHRDIKPSNIIFVDGVPKLADIGLVAGIDEAHSYVGTEGFIPPEGPGTPQADVYSLGKVLYELATGKDRLEFPSLPPGFEQPPDGPGFLELNEIILRACEGEQAKRYQSASELLEDLVLLHRGKSVRRLRMFERHWRLIKMSAAVLVVVALLGTTFLREVSRRQRLLVESRQRQVGSEVARGTYALDEGDLLGALPAFVEALRLDQGDLRREALHRTRIGAVLAQAPRLVRAWAWKGCVNDVAFSPDGERVAVGQWFGEAQVLSVVTGLPVSPPFGKGQGLEGIAFSPDGHRVATAGQSRTVILWDASSGRELLRLAHPAGVLATAFSPKGDRIVTASMDGRARIWDASSGQLLRDLGPHGDAVNHAAFSGDSAFVVTASRDQTAQVWDARTGERVGRPLAHKSWVYHASFSPSGRRVVTACFDRRARVWDARTGEEVPFTISHSDAVRSAEFSPDGRYILTASWDSTVHLWSAATGRAVRLNALLPHSDRVMTAAFSPAGHRVATACVDGTIRIWDLAANRALPEPIPGFLSADGSRFLMNASNPVEVRATADPQHALQRLTSPTTIGQATLNRDGSFALTLSGPEGGVSAPPLLRVWSVASGAVLCPPIACTNSLDTVWLSDDGRRLAWAAGTNVLTRELSTGQALTPPLVHRGVVTAGLFSPEGGRLLTVGGKLVDVWNLFTGQRLFPTLGHSLRVARAVFSGDGRYLVTCTADETLTRGAAQVWNAWNGLPIGGPLGHRDGVLSAEFSPDGRRLVTASEDFTAIVWNIETGKPIGRPLRHDDQVQEAAFSPDGRSVITAGSDQTARVWDADTGQPLTPPLPHPRTLWHARFLGDGQHLVTGKLNREGWRWALPREDRSVGDLLALAHLFTSDQLPSGEAGPAKGGSGLMDSWLRLRSQYPDSFAVSKREIIAWHGRELDQAEEEGQLTACLFHLDRLRALGAEDQAFIERRERISKALREER